jgi:K+-transporting ATPase ATPase C chain
MNHLRANLLLLVLTLVLCSVLYPLCLWVVGQTVFHDKAQGSLVTDDNGKVVGSRLIAQEFKGDEYFQPRPSAAGYNAAASGASNWGANNYQLRDRVAKQLGPIVRYGKDAARDGKKPGDLVGPDIENWFQKNRYQGRRRVDIVRQWASLHSGLAEGWIKDTDNALKPQWQQNGKDRPAGQSFLAQLAQNEPALHQQLVAALNDPAVATPADLAREFFPLLHGEWLTVEDDPSGDNPRHKKLLRGKESADIQGTFFDLWRQEHPHLDLEEVPADMVMASGSGLDPHITLENAQYQLKYRVAEARAAKMIRATRNDWDKLDAGQRKTAEEQARKALEAKVGKNLEERLREVIGALLTESASSPLGGLAGVPLVNVLEVNVALDQRVKRLAETGK